MKNKNLAIKLTSYIFVGMAAAVLTLFATGSLRIAKVSGHSMEPTLNDGDILIVSALSEERNNDILILDTEGTGLDTQYIIKRYYEYKSTEKRVWLEGDNKGNSLDSRKLGTFNRDEIVGTAIFDITQMKGLR